MHYSIYLELSLCKFFYPTFWQNVIYHFFYTFMFVTFVDMCLRIRQHFVSLTPAWTPTGPKLRIHSLAIESEAGMHAGRASLPECDPLRDVEWSVFSLLSPYLEPSIYLLSSLLTLPISLSTFMCCNVRRPWAGQVCIAIRTGCV